jgi:hypothetical protein
MRVNAEQRLVARYDLGVIEEYKGLDQLTDVGGADEAPDRAMLVATRAKDDLARALGALVLIRPGNHCG